ncbi:MAG: pilus assembly protein [Desulfobacterales bacterium]|nr:MAG: pilus assembly protein [Desulfobacterales bacterium]
MKPRNQRGATALELTILLPLLLILIFGIIEFSIILYDKQMITNASREGARAGIVYNEPADIPETTIQQIVENYCADHLISFSAGVTQPVLDPPPAWIDDPDAGRVLRVTVRYQYNFLVFPDVFTLFAGVVSDGLTLVAETTMRMERQEPIS